MAPDYHQSSVIPVRLNENEIQILLITSLNSGQWIFPKGIIDKGLTAREAAAQEAYEEAGVKGNVPDIILGSYAYQKWGGTCHVKVYPMIVREILDKWPESEERRRSWVSLNKAQKMIKKRELCILLDNLKKNLSLIQQAIESFP